MSETTQPILKLEQLNKHFPIRGGILKRVQNHVYAVNDISIEVETGDSVGIVGESGCGKSTLGRTILGLEEATKGKVYFKNHDITNIKEKSFKKFKKDMQMIFQDPFASLDPRQRIGDTLEEPFVIHTDLSKKERQERVVGLLNEVGLNASHYYNYPHQFSGGQRQRIGIARAIALNPELIVCDEAVSALDVSVQAQVLKLLQTIQDKYELTYLFISHDLGVVRHFCNKILVMYLGHMVEWAPIDELYENPTHPYTEALLNAIPRPIPGRKQEKIKLTGDLPSPSDPPKGCPFHTRCPIATEVCSEQKPEWVEISPDHFVACHHRT
ncbi:peptide ABC transporter substrate-binding protein [Halalkalibacillus sediminis]|uniref:Peptide ABC transporter substrate-binding protein n=1 Tax=Halalkalibacillus sediminis TaxID=2018042 RepID=A0A2I0QSU4_9BACI|nr:dipeptide ABC transporter ATP-binding protein [Halalkalibacillus sediminis]PKR77180.1 peptide ABC transporter substrate-binding protein [Halalkalibacillus sediminis]